MDTQLTSNAEALRLFFTEDIYLVTEKEPVVDVDALGPLSTKKEAVENIAIGSLLKVKGEYSRSLYICL